MPLCRNTYTEQSLGDICKGNTEWLYIYNAADTMYFFYDQNGAPYALMYNNVTYYYILNVQGDVIRLVDSMGTTVASYVYDPYGNMVSATGSMAQKKPYDTVVTTTTGRQASTT